ncbi:unnamed protein product [Caenorhabditis bovis]|uniref:C2H2-type domain-containing protein n=1 Tax=Caenorhabditis bovis TaxID=2654633 RepID=A0A8S1EU65_9PELO|nr:unnamed protein product [Caenorhabditis bovis]
MRSDAEEGQLSSSSESTVPAAYKKIEKAATSSSSTTWSSSCSDSDWRDGRDHQRKRRRRIKRRKDRPMFPKKDEQLKKSSSFTGRRDRKLPTTRKRARRCSSSSCDSSPTVVVRRVRRRFKCEICDHVNFSLKGFVHHGMTEHNLGVTCHVCRMMFAKRGQWMNHYAEHHPDEAVQCIYCKAKFEKPDRMSEKRWEFVHQHIYGEIFYSRLAEFEETQLSPLENPFE